MNRTKTISLSLLKKIFTIMSSQTTTIMLGKKKERRTGFLLGRPNVNSNQCYQFSFHTPVVRTPNVPIVSFKPAAQCSCLIQRCRECVGKERRMFGMTKNREASKLPRKGPGIDTPHMGIDTPGSEIPDSTLVSIPCIMVLIPRPEEQHSPQVLGRF